MAPKKTSIAVSDHSRRLVGEVQDQLMIELGRPVTVSEALERMAAEFMARREVQAP